MVDFFVVLGTKLLVVSASPRTRIWKAFLELSSRPSASTILRGWSYEDCKFYKLEVPVPLPDDLIDDAQVIQKCLDESNWKEVSHYALLSVLASTLTDDHVYMVIKPPGGETEKAIEALYKDDATLFRCLQVKVSKLQSWSMDDVSGNLENGTFFNHGSNRTCSILSGIESRMAQRRTYNVPTGENRELQNALRYPTYFEQIFVASQASSIAVKNDREFGAFFNILRYYHADSARIQTDPSSSLKASNFTVYFILPPFFSSPSEYFEYKEQMSWGFPIFLATHEMSQSWCKFCPNSDFMVSSPSFLCPFIISEVVSQKNESDRYRMLVQAIAIARAGQYLMTAGEQFFVVGIYLRKNLIAERFVVANTGPARQVSIAQRNFDLARKSEAVLFLCEMFNLATMLEDLAGTFDPQKEGRLSSVKATASKVISLNEMAKQNRSRSRSRATTGPMTSVTESREPGDAQDDLGVFGADDIQAVLKALNYKIDFVLFEFPLVAVVSNMIGESEKGYLKFVREGQKEIEILQYLTGIKSPSNHTISGVRIWPVRGGNVISMPMAGTWLTDLNNRDAQLWSVANQLFEAVDFMHQHGVAHLDLKPANIIIPVNGGRLTIIDFNRSVRVNGVNDTFSGIVGTDGYLPPEVKAGRGLYSAIRADLWSCGKTLHELCASCWPSADREALLAICQQLMNEDPAKRPMMSDVLERMACCKVDNTAPDCLSFSSVGSPQ